MVCIRPAWLPSPGQFSCSPSPVSAAGIRIANSAANLITGGRALILALVAGVALAPEAPVRTWPLVLTATAATSADLLDGILARRSGMASRFGARFDMEVDALLVLALSLLAWRAANVGPWIVAAGVMRYAFIAAGWLLRADA